MIILFLSFRVRDYDFWREGYKIAIKETPEVRAFRIWRGLDDPNYVITAETFDSRAIAEEVLARPETKKSVQGDGIDLSTLRVELDQPELVGSALRSRASVCL
jgi:hypothetical protein